MGLLRTGQSRLAYTLANWLRRLRRNASLQPARFSLIERAPLDVSLRARSGARRRGMAGLGRHGAIDLASGLDPAESLQSGEIIVFGQAPGGNHHAGPGLPAAMPGFLLRGRRMVGRDLAETGPGVGQQRVLVGLQRQALRAPPRFATLVGGHRGQRQAQPGGIGRDHHPGPRAQPLVAGAAQRLAVNGDDIAVAEPEATFRRSAAYCRFLKA